MIDRDRITGERSGSVAGKWLVACWSRS